MVPTTIAGTKDPVCGMEVNEKSAAGKHPPKGSVQVRTKSSEFTSRSAR
jgi:hypothetical protein